MNGSQVFGNALPPPVCLAQTGRIETRLTRSNRTPCNAIAQTRTQINHPTARDQMRCRSQALGIDETQSDWWQTDLRTTAFGLSGVKPSKPPLRRVNRPVENTTA